MLFRYEVKGIGIKTGRDRKRIYLGHSEEEAIEEAKNDGTEVLEIKKLPPEPPTKNQLDYARDLGIKIPPDAGKQDVSNLIDMHVSHDKFADDRMLSFAEKYGAVEYREWQYIGKKKLFDTIWNHLLFNDRHKDMIAWFAFRVYRGMVEGRYDVEIEDPWHPIIIKIAEKYKDDEKIIKSLRRYEGRKLIWFGEVNKYGETYYGGSKRTIVYRTIYDELAKALKSSDLHKKKEKKQKEVHVLHNNEYVKNEYQNTAKKKNKYSRDDRRLIQLTVVVVAIIVLITIFGLLF